MTTLTRERNLSELRSMLSEQQLSDLLDEPWQFAASFRLSETPGEFEADCCPLGVDSHPSFFGDVVNFQPGSYDDIMPSLNENESGDSVAILFSHDRGLPPIGQGLSFRATRRMLSMHARLRLEDDGIAGQYARSTRNAMLDGSLHDVSVSVDWLREDEEIEELEDAEPVFGFPPLRIKVSRVNTLFEVSPTLAGRMPDARVRSAFSRSSGRRMYTAQHESHEQAGGAEQLRRALVMRGYDV